MSSPATRLTAPYFYLPLLHVLATLTKYKANVAVDMDDVIQKVIDLTEVSPDDYGQESSGRPWVRRWITWAFRNHQAKPEYERKFNKGQPGTTTSPGRRKWALTPAGVQMARTIRKDFIPKLNTTAEWLGNQLATTKLEKKLHLHLSQKLAISASSQRIADHVQDYFMDVVARDTFGQYIKAGKPPTHRMICGWAAKMAFSTCRKDGQDAHMRGLYGSQTARDREENNPRSPASFTMPDSAQVVTLSEDDKGRVRSYIGVDVFSGPMLDVVDPSSMHMEDAVIGDLALDYTMNRLSEILDEAKPGADGRYAEEILEAYRLGYSTRDLAAAPSENNPLGQDVSINRASALWGEMRRTLRDAVEEGRLEDVGDLFFDNEF